jgi:hypothetical protein
MTSYLDALEKRAATVDQVLKADLPFDPKLALDLINFFNASADSIKSSNSATLQSPSPRSL